MAQYNVPAPITINGLATDFETAKLGLSEVMLHSTSKLVDYRPMMYNKANFKQKTMKKKVYAGLTQAATWDAESPIPTAGMQFLYDVSATHAWFAKATEYTLDSETFDEYNLLNRLPAELGKAVGEKYQRLAAAHFNDGFTTAWEDGTYFFSASHPYDSRYSSSTYQSNLVSGALAVSTLQDAINLLLNVRDPLNRPMTMMPKYLYVHPTKVITARQILGIDMAMEYNKADNNRNPFKDYSIKVIPFPWMSTTTMWFLQGDETFTYYSEAVGPTTKVDRTDSHALKMEEYFCCAFWAEFWQGWVGSLGT